MRAKRGAGSIGLLAALVAVGSARAQPPVEVRVVAAGMSVTGIEVFVLVDGEPFRVGATDAEGRLSAPGDLAGLRPGDPVHVHQLVCARGRSLLLAPPDEDPESECERRAREDPSCACGSLGVFGWGGDIVVDLVEEPPPVAAQERRAGPRWIVAAGAGWSSWPNLDKGCEASPQAVACDLDAARPTFRAGVEARPFPDRPFSLLGAIGYTRDLVIDHTFGSSPNPHDPQRNRSEMDVVTFEGYAVGRLPAGPALDLFLALGYVWAYDRVEATTTFGAPGLAATEKRADSGGRLGGRAGLDWWSTGERWGARLEVGGMTGEGDDIDASWGAVGMVLLAVGR